MNVDCITNKYTNVMAEKKATNHFFVFATSSYAIDHMMSKASKFVIEEN